MSLGWVKNPWDRLLVRVAMIAIPAAACLPLVFVWRDVSAWPSLKFWLVVSVSFVATLATLLLGMRLNERRGAFDLGRFGVVVGGWMWFVGAAGAFTCFGAAVWRGIDSISK